jgi:biotin carboxyl carrier protein
MTYEVTVGGRTRHVDVRRAGDGWVVSVDGGAPRSVGGGRVGTAEWRVEQDGAAQIVGLVPDGGDVHVQIDGHALRVKVVDPRKDALSLGAASQAGSVVTEMPGAVVRVLVSQGQAVTKGQPVVVVEAMKMENEFRASIAGTVARIAVKPGDRVESGTLLLAIEPGEP